MITTQDYLAYNRDVRYLLHWLINTQNEILRSSASEANGPTTELNTTGRTSLAGLVSMSQLIAQSLDSIPDIIYRLFQSIIKARANIHMVIVRLSTARSPTSNRNRAIQILSTIIVDLPMIKASLKFIESFDNAFKALGGDPSFVVRTNEKYLQPTLSQMDIEEVVLDNKLKELDLEKEEEEGASSEEAAQSPQQTSGPRQIRAKKSSKKSKKNKKKGKKSQKKQKKTELEGLPLEKYKIIEDKDAVPVNYFMASHAAVHHWVDLRYYCQDLWRDVAYNGLNSAVAGATSNMAALMIKRDLASFFDDLPGWHCYQSIVDSITFGDPEKIQGEVKKMLCSFAQNPETQEADIEEDVDVKELLMGYAYDDLVDFITDFQKNYTGKPTKAMKATLHNWDPEFDLESATTQQRLEWRRKYTINWLYDLFNVFTSTPDIQDYLHNLKYKNEDLSWIFTPDRAQPRRLFGLAVFAVSIVTLAMQKLNVDFKKLIKPYHVFHLQCIVDSMTVSRGWSWSAIRGHVLRSPAADFRPIRDVDLFLDREKQRQGSGFLQGIDVLCGVLRHKQSLYGESAQAPRIPMVLGYLRGDLTDWLGESNLKHGIDGVPPSRFSKTNTNGFWEYSPFLCGAGLMEGLEAAYQVGTTLWDAIPEPILAVHLHNMLLKKRYIATPVLVYAALGDLFREVLFVDGKAPKSNFAEALTTKLSQKGKRDGLDNRLHKRVSSFYLYQKADWNPEAIPDKDLIVPSFLFVKRLDRIRVSVDPLIKKKSLEDCDLLHRARQAGITDEDIFALMGMDDRIQDGTGTDQSADDVENPPGDASSSVERDDLHKTLKKVNEVDFTSPRGLLDWVKRDLQRDVNGDRPLVSLNYIWVAARFMMLFKQVEERLDTLMNPTYLRIYKTGTGCGSQKRVTLTKLVLSGKDEECMRVFAEEIENLRSSFLTHIYWDGLDIKGENEASVEGVQTPDSEDRDMCRLM